MRREVKREGEEEGEEEEDLSTEGRRTDDIYQVISSCFGPLSLVPTIPFVPRFVFGALTRGILDP